jgi:hypothetical protein
MLKSKLLICLSRLPLLLQVGVVSCSGFIQGAEYINPAKHPVLVDQSWLLNDKHCSAPCWKGLAPGISTQAESLSLVTALSFIGDKEELDNFPGYVIFRCKMPSAKNCLEMQFENDLLISLRLYPNYQVTFEEVVAALGPPDSFYYSRRDVERKGCTLSVLWISRQIDVGYGDRSSLFGDDLCDLIWRENGKLPKGLLVSQVHYMTSNQINGVIEIVRQPETGQNYTLWNGFAE